MSAEPFHHARVRGEVSAILDDLGGASPEQEAILLAAIIRDCQKRLSLADKKVSAERRTK